MIPRALGSLAAGAVVFGAIIGASGPARAQVVALPVVTPLVGPPQVAWLGPAGDASGASGSALTPSFVLEPLRMALTGTAVPTGRFEPGCGEHVEATGTATAGVPGFAMQHATSLQLVPKLTLFGFSRGGCAIDAGVGGGVAYATLLRKDIWLVASAGILHLPHAGPGGASITRFDVRADVVFARPKGRSYTVGVGTRGVTFGGTL
jgi:hypothetical protein